jgi:hypothetical protein
MGVMNLFHWNISRKSTMCPPGTKASRFLPTINNIRLNINSTSARQTACWCQELPAVVNNLLHF